MPRGKYIQQLFDLLHEFSTGHSGDSGPIRKELRSCMERSTRLRESVQDDKFVIRGGYRGRRSGRGNRNLSATRRSCTERNKHHHRRCRLIGDPNPYRPWLNVPVALTLFTNKGVDANHYFWNLMYSAAAQMEPMHSQYKH